MTHSQIFLWKSSKQSVIVTVQLKVKEKRPLGLFLQIIQIFFSLGTLFYVENSTGIIILSFHRPSIIKYWSDTLRCVMLLIFKHYTNVYCRGRTNICWRRCKYLRRFVYGKRDIEIHVLSYASWNDTIFIRIYKNTINEFGIKHYN